MKRQLTCHFHLFLLLPQLYDNKASQGKVAPEASKESAAQQAAQVALKMYFQSQGDKKGGSAGLLQLASKFL
jgi:hypothetical protein